MSVFFYDRMFCPSFLPAAAGLKDVSAKVVYDFKKPAGDNPDELLDFHLFMAVGKSAE